MKLAEALMLRTDMQTRLASLKARIAKNTVIQDGEKPNEDPTALIAQANTIIKERAELIAEINATNQTANIENQQTLSQLITKREELTAMHSLLQTAIDASSAEHQRYSLTEIKWVTTINISKLQKQADGLSVKIRKMNLLIQQANWTVDLIEN